MKKLFLLGVLALLCLISTKARSQDFENNLHKYWKFRDRLRQDFVRIGSEKGQSIPAGARSIGFAYSGAPSTSEGLSPSRIYYTDATIYLGHYITVLATEYKLLNDASQPVESTLNELYFALAALNRLDKIAENYHLGVEHIMSDSDLDGMMLRDDVPLNFHVNNYSDDYSETFERNADIIRVHSDYNPLEVWGTTNTLAGYNYDFTARNISSQDQYYALFIALRSVHDLVGNITVQPTPSSAPMNLKTESKAIVNRMLDQIVRVEDVGVNVKADFRLFRPDGTPIIGDNGGDLTAYAPFIIKLGVYFDHPTCELLDGMNPHQVEVRLGIAIEEVDAPGLLSLLEPEAVNGVAYCGTIPLSTFHTLFDEIENQSINFSRFTGGDNCLDMHYNLYQAINNIKINLPGTIWDETTEVFLPLTYIPSLILHFAPRNEILRLALSFKNYVISAGAIIVDLFDPNHTYFTICIADDSKIRDDDNLHMFCEMALSSGYLDGNYIKMLAEGSSMQQYILMWDIFHNNSQTQLSSDNTISVEGILNSAPCNGPFEDPLAAQGTTGVAEWRSMSRIHHPGNRTSGDSDPSFRGEFSGLDYMYYYNAYHILHANDQLPEYKRTNSCQCREEISNLSQTQEAIDVSRKFPDYREMGIPIEAYLAHSLEMNGTEANVEVKNDLIICREEPTTITEFSFVQGATMNLYEGNTITIGINNELHFYSGSTLRTGLVDDGCCDGISTIHILEGGRLIFEDGADLHLFDNLEIICDNGALVRFEGAVSSSEIDGVCNITGETGAMIDIIDSGLYFEQFNIQLDNYGIVNMENSILAGNNAHINLNNLSDFNLTSNSELNISGSAIEVREGSTFTIDNSTLGLWGGSDIHFSVESPEELVPVCYYNGGQIILDGHESIFALEGGHVNVADGATFTFDHPNESGYVLIGNGYDYENEFVLGEESSLLLYGDDNGDCILKIMDWAGLWFEENTGSIKLKDGLVNMNNNGQFWTGPSLYASNVRFVDWDTENGHASFENWYSPSTFVNCEFEGVKVKSIGATLDISSTSFLNNKSGVTVNGGSYRVERSDFTNCGIISDRLDRTSFVTQSNFNRNGIPNVLSAISDNSIVDLILQSNSINGYKKGVSKSFGILVMKCNSVLNTFTGVVVNNAELNMSSKNGAGYNTFDNNRTNIYLIDATNVWLNVGYNDFTGYTYHNIDGTIQWNCTNTANTCYGPQLDAMYNKWPTTPINGTSSPEPNNPVGQAYDCFVYTTPTLGGICNQGGNCGIPVYWLNPISSFVCSDTKPVIHVGDKKSAHFENSDTDSNYEFSRNDAFVSQGSGMQLRDYEVGNDNPLINSANFIDTPLDSALTIAASYLEQYDSLGNDIQAIQLFHEILTDDLDRSNEKVRFMMNWGVDHMKSALENSFTNGDLTVVNNQTSFETPVSQYVDVLNFMTDTLLTADTYKEQFYVELNKGQLFKTLEKPLLAKSIFLHLDDCELDSMEQSILNTWKTQIEIDMSVRSQFEEGVPMDSILFEAGTQSAFEPESFITSNYYFGVWINSPSSLSFVNCGSNAVYRNLYLTNISAELYPNPTSDVLNVRITDGEEAFDKLTIYNAAGQIVLTSRVQLSNGDMYTLQLPSEISTGTYILRLSNEHFVSDMTFQKY